MVFLKATLRKETLMPTTPYLFDVPAKKKLRVIIDSDAACEADDSFAITHALLSPKLLVRAVIAEHFALPGSMEQSFEKICCLTGLLKSSVPVLRGQEGPLTGEETLFSASEGVRFLIAEARREDPNPLFVLCMGALSNVAAALQLAPDIAENMTVVSIGGHEYERDKKADFKEFNFGNDVTAANVLLRSRVPFWQIPVTAYGQIRIGLAELQCKVRPCGAVGEYLFTQMTEYNQSEMAFWTPGESWSLGDSPSVAVTLDPSCGIWDEQPAREVLADTSYGEELPGRLIRVYRSVDSRCLLEDFFAKLSLSDVANHV